MIPGINPSGMQTKAPIEQIKEAMANPEVLRGPAELKGCGVDGGGLDLAGPPAIGGGAPSGGGGALAAAAVV